MIWMILRGAVCGGSGCFAPVADAVAGADARCLYSCAECCRVTHSMRRFFGRCCKSYRAVHRCNLRWKDCANHPWHWKVFAERVGDCDDGWMRCARCCAGRRHRRRAASACRSIKHSNIYKRSSLKARPCSRTINFASGSRSWAKKLFSKAQYAPFKKREECAPSPNYRIAR